MSCCSEASRSRTSAAAESRAMTITVQLGVASRGDGRGIQQDKAELECYGSGTSSFLWST